MELQRGIDPQRSWTKIDIPTNEFKTYQLSSNNHCLSVFDLQDLRLKNPTLNKTQEYRTMVEIATLPFLSKIVEDLLETHYEKIEVSSNYCPSKGTDIAVYSDNKLLLKMEVLNWWVLTVLSQRRASMIRESLKGAPFKILYIPTKWNFMSRYEGINPASLKILKEVSIYYSGFQILPITYFEYFEKLDSRFTLFRSVLSQNIVNYQKRQLKRFFENIELLPVVKN